MMQLKWKNYMLKVLSLLFTHLYSTGLNCPSVCLQMILSEYFNATDAKIQNVRQLSFFITN